MGITLKRFVIHPHAAERRLDLIAASLIVTITKNRAIGMSNE
ncbi:hypothetical protein VAE122_860002 [Vibrio aestuarianus]|nr:hypothetical protein VAE122_860002 [Vibrio aestuarianus]